jgi:hypothetical protein
VMSDSSPNRRRAPTKCSPVDPPPRTTTFNYLRWFAFRNPSAICFGVAFWT